ncbi:MAG TPA: hypothetical protein VD861_18400 [Pyrinomonadaceae bacterium]|nr:hypothetical protein [Pyrinomonadaceae bacterium]
MRSKCLHFIAAFLLLTACAPVLAQSGFVTARGKQFVAPGRRPLFLKGINLGKWLLPEGYTLKFKTASSPRLIETVVNQLVGPDEARKFWRAYRDRYITRDDIQFIKRAGFNSVRVPELPGQRRLPQGARAEVKRHGPARPPVRRGASRTPPARCCFHRETWT